MAHSLQTRPGTSLLGAPGPQLSMAHCCPSWAHLRRKWRGWGSWGQGPTGF